MMVYYGLLKCSNNFFEFYLVNVRLSTPVTTYQQSLYDFKS